PTAVELTGAAVAVQKQPLLLRFREGPGCRLPPLVCAQHKDVNGLRWRYTATRLQPAVEEPDDVPLQVDQRIGAVVDAVEVAAHIHPVRPGADDELLPVARRFT